MTLWERLDARRDIVRVCHRLYDRGLVAGPDGNVSVRLRDGTILITASGLSKGELTSDDIVELRPDGERTARGASPSSEVAMHLRIYQRRHDVRAVVHAHPPTATGLAVAGEDFMAPVLPEIILQLGQVPLVPYAPPGTEALPDAMEPYLAGADGLLLANHGATTLGPTLVIAHQRMESLEHAARIVLAARLAGGVRELSAEQASELARRREQAREQARERTGSTLHPDCPAAGSQRRNG